MSTVSNVYMSTVSNAYMCTVSNVHISTVSNVDYYVNKQRIVCTIFYIYLLFIVEKQKWKAWNIWPEESNITRSLTVGSAVSGTTSTPGLLLWTHLDSNAISHSFWLTKVVHAY